MSTHLLYAMGLDHPFLLDQIFHHIDSPTTFWISNAMYPKVEDLFVPTPQAGSD